LFCVGYFQDRASWTICQGWFQIMILLISSSWVARIVCVSRQHIPWDFLLAQLTNLCLSMGELGSLIFSINIWSFNEVSEFLHIPFIFLHTWAFYSYSLGIHWHVLYVLYKFLKHCHHRSFELTNWGFISLLFIW
jgi:hypothetical protein